MSLDREAWTIVGTCVLGLALIGALAAWVVSIGSAWEEDCQALGGHVKTTYSTGTGVMPNGKVGILTTSSSLCLTSDGRIIEVP